jgi:hypothetical protein
MSEPPQANGAYLAFSSEFSSALQHGLPLLCEKAKCGYAEVWLPRGDTGIECSDVWYSEYEYINRCTVGDRIHCLIYNLSFLCYP